MDLSAAIHTALLRVAERARDHATDEVPYRTTDLRSSLTVQEVNEETVSMGTNLEYAKYVHQGTGLYGPSQQRIRPKTKKALYWPGAEHPVRSVRGQPPNPFMERALERTAADVPEVLDGVLPAEMIRLLQENLRTPEVQITL